MLSLAACGGGSGGGGGGGGNTAPTANAGADQTVDELTNVALTGSGSDANGDTLTYSWMQTAGTQVTLNNGDMAQANFDAHDVAPGAPETLTFQLTVSDGTASTTDSVDILVREPAAFLMDEPLSSLDAKLREDLRVELKRIQVDMGATILYVTHDQIEAMTMADRIGVLREGRLVQVGTPRQVYAEPETDYVALRLGSPRINLLPMGALGITEGPAGAETIGIRPEDVVLGRGDGLGEVLTVEHLGAETVVLLRIGGHEVHALAGPGEPARPGDRVIVSTLPEAALYFDRDGRRLPWRADGASKQLLEAGHGA